MKSIPLTQGKHATVDDEDFKNVNQHKWFANIRHGHWYAQRNVRLPNGKRVTEPMHRFILGLGFGNPHQVDHKDRTLTLDNRRENLRIATGSQNSCNRGIQKNNKSGFLGVSWSTQVGKWKSQITVNRKNKLLGYFATPELAAIARDEAALKYDGSFACTNASLGLLDSLKKSSTVRWT